MMFKRWAGAVVNAVVVVTAVSACGAPPPPKLSASLGWVTEAYLYARLGQVHTYGGINPCIAQGSGSVTITDLKPARSSGIAFTGWGSRPNPFLTGGSQNGGLTKTMASDGFSVGPAVMGSAVCGEDTVVARELAIEFHRTDPKATGWIDGLTVGFTVGHSKTVHHELLTLDYALCGGTSLPTQHFGKGFCPG